MSSDFSNENRIFIDHFEAKLESQKEAFKSAKMSPKKRKEMSTLFNEIEEEIEGFKRECRIQNELESIILKEMGLQEGNKALNEGLPSDYGILPNE